MNPEQKHGLYCADDSFVEKDIGRLLVDRLDGFRDSNNALDDHTTNVLLMYKMLLYIHDNIRELGAHKHIDHEYIEQDVWDIIVSHFSDFIKHHRHYAKIVEKNRKGDES